MKVDHTIWDSSTQPPVDGKNNKVFFIGSINTAMHLIAGRYRYQLWFGRAFDYSYMLGHINGMLNQEALLFSAGQARLLISEDQRDLDEKMYTRSNSGFKKLCGDVRSHGQLIDDIIDSNLFKEELIALTCVKKIGKEYRVVIKSKYNEGSDSYDYKIVTSSLYMENGEPVES
jgi:hypothetical protein